MHLLSLFVMFSAAALPGPGLVAPGAAVPVEAVSRFPGVGDLDLVSREPPCDDVGFSPPAVSTSLPSIGRG